MHSTHACPLHPVDAASVRFHPLENYGLAALDAVGGPYLDDIAARAVPLLLLGRYVPQIRMRRNRHDLPDRLAYGIRLDQILRRKVHSAAAVRQYCGVPAASRLVLLCFAEDPVLEVLWEDASRARAIARGGWDLITAPSYSLWYGRPRPFHFHSIRRSFDVFRALQSQGASVVPRVEFVDLADVDVQAHWFNANPIVEMASLDWMTCRNARDWLDGAELLATFDRGTGSRLHYLVNGTTTVPRIAHLVELLGEKRLTLTDATIAKPPPSYQRGSDRLSHELLPNAAFKRLVAAREAEIEVAIHAVNATGSTQTKPEYLTTENSRA